MPHAIRKGHGRLELYIGNKNYSSWSLRAWLLFRHLGIDFTEHMVSVAGRDYNPALKHVAGNARVPCLHENGFQIWESLAIAEHLAERHPELWPADEHARARARPDAGGRRTRRVRARAAAGRIRLPSSPQDHPAYVRARLPRPWPSRARHRA